MRYLGLEQALREIFPGDSCTDRTLDGHAAMAYDSVYVFIRAAGHLTNPGREIPITPAAVWRELSNIHDGAAGAFPGASGIIDFGGNTQQQVPSEKLVVILTVGKHGLPEEVAYCGRREGTGPPAAWCPTDSED